MNHQCIHSNGYVIALKSCRFEQNKFFANLETFWDFVKYDARTDNPVNQRTANWRHLPHNLLTTRTKQK